MHAQETILFLAVAVLATALIVVLVAPRWRGSRTAAGDPGVKPHDPGQAVGKTGVNPSPVLNTGVVPRRASSGQAFAGASLAPAVEGQSTSSSSSGPSVSVVTASPPPPPGHMICPTCRRQFAAGLRYCPYDARLLTADLHQPGRPMPQASSASGSAASAGKICPNCARRYDSVALVCGRDGTALVSVN